MRRRWPFVLALTVALAGAGAVAGYLLVLRARPRWVIEHAPLFPLVRQAYLSRPDDRFVAAAFVARCARPGREPVGLVAGLSDWLRDEPDGRMRAKVAAMMRMARHQPFAAPLRAAFARETDDGVRYAIVEALLTVHDPPAGLLCLDRAIADDPGRADRLVALLASTKAVAADAVPRLVALTRHGDDHVAGAAAAALGFAGIDPVLADPALRGLMDSPRGRIACLAVRHWLRRDWQPPLADLRRRHAAARELDRDLFAIALALAGDGEALREAVTDYRGHAAARRLALARAAAATRDPACLPLIACAMRDAEVFAEIVDVQVERRAADDDAVLAMAGVAIDGGVPGWVRRNAREILDALALSRAQRAAVDALLRCSDTARWPLEPMPGADP